MCVCVRDQVEGKRGQEVVIVTGNRLGAGEGNRDDKKVLDRYGVKEKNER